MPDTLPENVPHGTVARIGYDPETGLWELWEYGLRQSSTFDSIQQLADYLRDYPQQLLYTADNPPPRD